HRPITDQIAAVRRLAPPDAHRVHFGLAVSVVTEPDHVTPPRCARAAPARAAATVRSLRAARTPRPASTRSSAVRPLRATRTAHADRPVRAPAPASAGCRGWSGSGN